MSSITTCLLTCVLVLGTSSPPSAFDASDAVQASKPAELTTTRGWTPGEVRHELLTRSSVMRIGRSHRDMGGVRIPFTVTVLAADDEGYRPSWTYGKAELQGGARDGGPLMERLAGWSEGLDFILRLDPDGSLTGVENLEQIRTAAGEAADEFLVWLAAQGEDAERIRQFAEKTLDPKVLEQALEKNMELFLFPLGRRYQSDEPITHDTLLPNPFGGEAFPASGAIRWEPGRSADPPVRIPWSQAMDGDAASRILADALRRVDEQLGRTPPPPDAEVPNYSATDEGEFFLHSDPFWPSRWSCTRTMRSGEQSRADTVSARRMTRRR